MRRWLVIVGIGVAVLGGFAAYTVYAKLSRIEPLPRVSSVRDAKYSPPYRQLSASEKQHLLDAPFAVVTSVDAIPEQAKRAFAMITGQRQFSLANPGAKYQVTDVIVEPGLPFRRLVFAGASNDTWFVHYEHGGRGHSYSVVVFQLQHNNQVLFLWGGAGFGRAKDLQTLRSMIAEGGFRDDLQYYW